MSNRVPDFVVVYEDPEIVVINDVNMGNCSVTNGINFVIAQLNKRYDMTYKKLIYRDSIGIYDAVILKGGQFSGWYSLNEMDMFKAIAKYKSINF